MFPPTQVQQIYFKFIMATSPTLPLYGLDEAGWIWSPLVAFYLDCQKLSSEGMEGMQITLSIVTYIYMLYHGSYYNIL